MPKVKIVSDPISVPLADKSVLCKEEGCNRVASFGTSFGGDGINNFALPDPRSRVLGAIGNGSGLSNRGMGDKVGSETHTLLITEMPSHTHTCTTNSSGTHSHSTNAIGGQGNNGLVTANGSGTAINSDFSLGELNIFTTPIGLNIDDSGAHTHTFTSDSTGGGQAHNNMQPTIFIGNLFIYAGSF